MDRTTAVTTIVSALLAAGILNYVRDAVRAYRARRQASTPEAKEALHLATADQSLLVVVRARDELEEDNKRLRVTIAEERTRHAEDRAQWARDKANLRAEIDSLEARLRGLLDEVTALRSRTST